MPVGAFGGPKEIMQQLAPLGPVHQAGSLSGNPIAMAAGFATLQEISKPGFYESLEKTTQALTTGLLERAHAANILLTLNTFGSLFGILFTGVQPVQYYEQVMQCDVERFKKF